MEINFLIDQTDFNRYLLFVDNELKYIAKYKEATKEKSLWTADLSRQIAIGKLDKTFKKSFFSCIPFRINLLDSNSNINNEVIVYQKIFPYPFYEFLYENKHYFIYLHLGTKASIFVDSNQIGYYEKSAWKTGSSLNMKLVINKNQNIDLLCLVVLNIHSNFVAESNLEGNLPSYNISFQYKKFNSKWIPED